MTLFIFSILLTTIFSSTLGFSEEFIDLTTFLQKRTQQHPIIGYKKIYLATPPRTGSTLVYNVLRYLFENEDPYDWEQNYDNLVVKSHSDYKIKKDGIYVVTIRNPIEACLST